MLKNGLKFMLYWVKRRAIHTTARITVITTTCSGDNLGPRVSSSKYLTRPAPLGGRDFLSFFAIKSPINFINLIKIYS